MPVEPRGIVPPAATEVCGMVPKARLLALETAVPPHVLDQGAVATAAKDMFPARSDADRLLPVFANAGIARRFSCVPLAWYREPHGWAERNALYLEHAATLLEKSARAALAAAKLPPEAIDAVVSVSTTGIATPSLDALIAERLKLRRDIQRLPIVGLGCAGGVIGLARAGALARAEPGSRVLFLCVELCALTFRKRDLSKSNIVAMALFGDGAAAAILSTDGPGPALGASVEHTWPGSLDVMGWAVEEDGLKPIFSHSIPGLVETRLGAVFDAFLRKTGIRRPEIEAFACHPGGAKVLDALEGVLGLAPGELADSRAILRDYGNMSAVTALFVLKRIGIFERPRRTLMSALGPGFSAAFLMIEP